MSPAEAEELNQSQSMEMYIVIGLSFRFYYCDSEDQVFIRS